MNRACVIWGGTLLPATGLLVVGSAWGWVFAGLHVVLMLIGVFFIRSQILGRARTRVAGGVALTYDDGPDPETTPALLDLLRERGIVATFFVVGEKVRAHPEIVRRCVAEGHGVANHSDGHSNLTNLFLGGRMRREMEACQGAVLDATGTAPRHYRPPVGLMSPFVASAAASLGLEIVAWSIRSLDTVSDLRATERVAAGLKHGSIVLLHDGGLEREKVLALTGRVLDLMEERGLTAVTV